MAGVSSWATGRTNGTPGWPGPPVRNSSVPSRARELSPAATWSRSVPGTFPDLSSGTARYEQVNPGRPGHGCAPVSGARAGRAPGWPPGATAVQAVASRGSVNTVAAARVARATGRDMRMLVPPAQRSGSAVATLPRLDDVFQRAVRPPGSRRTRGRGGAGPGRPRHAPGHSGQQERGALAYAGKTVLPSAAWGC